MKIVNVIINNDNGVYRATADSTHIGNMFDHLKTQLKITRAEGDDDKDLTLLFQNREIKHCVDLTGNLKDEYIIPSNFTTQERLDIGFIFSNEGKIKNTAVLTVFFVRSPRPCDFMPGDLPEPTLILLQDLDRRVTALEEGGGTGGTTDHAELTNLDYENSGHIGFASTEDLNALKTAKTILFFNLENGIPVLTDHIPTERTNILPITWLPAEWGQWIEILSISPSPQVTAKSVRTIVGSKFNTKLWFLSSMARSNVQIRMQMRDAVMDEVLASGTTKINLNDNATTPIPAVLEGIYTADKDVELLRVRISISIMQEAGWALQVGIMTEPPDNVSFVSSSSAFFTNVVWENIVGDPRENIGLMELLDKKAVDLTTINAALDNSIALFAPHRQYFEVETLNDISANVSLFAGTVKPGSEGALDYYGINNDTAVDLFNYTKNITDDSLFSGERYTVANLLSHRITYMIKLELQNATVAQMQIELQGIRAINLTSSDSEVVKEYPKIQGFLRNSTSSASAPILQWDSETTSYKADLMFSKSLTVKQEDLFYFYLQISPTVGKTLKEKAFVHFEPLFTIDSIKVKLS